MYSDFGRRSMPACEGATQTVHPTNSSCTVTLSFPNGTKTDGQAFVQIVSTAYTFIGTAVVWRLTILPTVHGYPKHPPM